LASSVASLEPTANMVVGAVRGVAAVRLATYKSWTCY
jgi:hypothetical protein